MPKWTQEELEVQKLFASDVPCNGCTACCKKDRVVLNSDEAERFSWHPEGADKVMDRKPNGECINLTPTGCGVHEAPPNICSRFDCRVLYLSTPKERRVIRISQNPTMRAVYDAGKRLEKTLSKRY